MGKNPILKAVEDDDDYGLATLAKKKCRADPNIAVGKNKICPLLMCGRFDQLKSLVQFPKLDVDAHDTHGNSILENLFWMKDPCDSDRSIKFLLPLPSADTLNNTFAGRSNPNRNPFVFEAISIGAISTVRLSMIECDKVNINVTRKPTGESVLGFALMRGDTEAVKAILKRGANALVRFSSELSAADVVPLKEKLNVLREGMGLAPVADDDAKEAEPASRQADATKDAVGSAEKTSAATNVVVPSSNANVCAAPPAGAAVIHTIDDVADDEGPATKRARAEVL